jgi:valyl-tRNA synthetase
MPGSDLKLSEARTEGYRHFANKIWNASRFVLMNLEDLDTGEATRPAHPEELTLPDRWIRGRLREVIREVEASLEVYAFNEATHTLYQFVWHEFCDWYLELVKLYLYEDVERRRRALTQGTLLEVLDAVLRMLHPFMPFITEEIWQQLPLRKENESIMVSEFPKPEDRFVDEQVVDEMQLVIGVVTALRNIRGEMNLPPGEQIPVLLRTRNEETEDKLRRNRMFVQTLARTKDPEIGPDLEKPLYSAFVSVQDVEIFVPMDRSRMVEEMKRLEKELAKVEKEIAFVGKKLLNEQFVAKAPSEVVEEEREKAARYETTRDKLEEGLKKVRDALG